MSTKITDIYLRYLNGNISRVELDMLLLYFEQANQEELEALIEIGLKHPQEPVVEQKELEESLQKVYRNVIDYTKKDQRRTIRWRVIRYYAAASLLLVCGLCYFVMRQGNLPATDVAAPQASLLIKSQTGEEFNVSAGSDSMWTSDQVSYQLLDSQTLRISGLQKLSEPISQTLYAERSDFRVILEDGSSITLNAHSTLKLQVPFGPKERSVELSGEGFFDISHERGRPFKVLASDNLVEVLGTQFNVRNYPDDGQVTTSLLRGKIALSKQGSAQRVVLSPGDKAISGGTGIKVQHSGTRQAAAWKDRYFAYEDQPINTILMDLARWYNVKVDTQRVPPNRRIYMKIGKEQKLSEVLKLLGSTSGMSFSLQNGEIRADSTMAEQSR